MGKSKYAFPEIMKVWFSTTAMRYGKQLFKRHGLLLPNGMTKEEFEISVKESKVSGFYACMKVAKLTSDAKYLHLKE